MFLSRATAVLRPLLASSRAFSVGLRASDKLVIGKDGLLVAEKASRPPKKGTRPRSQPTGKPRSSQAAGTGSRDRSPTKRPNNGPNRPKNGNVGANNAGRPKASAPVNRSTPNAKRPGAPVKRDTNVKREGSFAKRGGPNAGPRAKRESSPRVSPKPAGNTMPTLEQYLKRVPKSINVSRFALGSPHYIVRRDLNRAGKKNATLRISPDQFEKVMAEFSKPRTLDASLPKRLERYGAFGPERSQEFLQTLAQIRKELGQ